MSVIYLNWYKKRTERFKIVTHTGEWEGLGHFTKIRKLTLFGTKTKTSIYKVQDESLYLPEHYRKTNL